MNVACCAVMSPNIPLSIFLRSGVELVVLELRPLFRHNGCLLSRRARASPQLLS